MRVKKSNIAWTVLFLSCFQSGLAQNGVILKATIDREVITIGEPVQFNLELNLPLGYNVQWPVPDSISHFVILERSKIDSTTTPDGKSFRQQLTVTSFDSGTYYIPSLAFHISNSIYLSDSLRVDIRFSDFDPSKDYHDIKGILEIENPWVRYIVWGLSLITLAALFLLILILSRKKTIVQAVQPVYVSKLSPYDEAIASLVALQKQQLPENGQVKTYYVQLNEIFKGFVLRRFQLATMDKTNEELILPLKRLNIRPEHFSKLAETLRMSDFVKFAKYLPASDDNNRNFEIIRTSIDYLNEIDN